MNLIDQNFSRIKLISKYVDNPKSILEIGTHQGEFSIKLLDNFKPNKLILVDPWNKFNDNCANFIQSRIDIYYQEQIKSINWRGDSDWVNQIIAYESNVDKIFAEKLDYKEGFIARECINSIQDKGQLIIGNSMPIRDIDMFTSTSQKKVTIYSNRGASGIDGVVSTALGISKSNPNV